MLKTKLWLFILFNDLKKCLKSELGWPLNFKNINDCFFFNLKTYNYIYINIYL